jgi:hypothetical protein
MFGYADPERQFAVAFLRNYAGAAPDVGARIVGHRSRHVLRPAQHPSHRPAKRPLLFGLRQLIGIQQVLQRLGLIMLLTASDNRRSSSGSR